MEKIISELSNLLKEKKIIPFIGAGFSIDCGFPSWKELIEHLLISFNINLEDVKDKTDFLRIAEYIKLLNRGKIGPIRYELHKLFNENVVDISSSEPHLNLVSLDTPIIYTTNFDNLIETAFEYTGRSYSKIVTTEDLIRENNSNFTQIIKFHGSFEHEETLVITESDYFKRLEFELPIDIKLRSDLLGRSLIFIGYSFSDFNIRYLWFKLKNMMKGIKEEDIPKSYIVLVENNIIMDLLFKNIGIIPIYLDEFNGNSINEKLSNFLEGLVVRMNYDNDWPFEMPVIATNSQIEKLFNSIENNDKETAMKYLWLLSHSQFGQNQLKLLLKEKCDGSDLGYWFFLIEKSESDVKRELAEFMIKLKHDYKIEFYDIFVVGFLRYREIRDVIINNNWIYFNDLMSKKKLSNFAEFQTLYDALTWIKYSDNLKRDTTLYFELVISTYFKERMDELIFIPDNIVENVQFSKNKINFTPARVLDILLSSADWIPTPSVFEEHEFDNICEALGCLLQTTYEFDWNKKYNTQDIIKLLEEK